MNINYLIILVGQESGHGLAASSGSASLHKASIKLSARAVVSSESSTGGESVSKLTHVAVGK